MRTVSFLIKLLFSLLFTVILLEVGLRFFPGVIPLDFLIHFDPDPRAEIARDRGLATKKWDVVYLERDDGGPPLEIFRPFTEVTWPVKDNETTSVVVMDDVGFCNPPENSYHLPTIDLITLGDSFTACHAVDPSETWTSKLSRRAGLSAYNLGKGGKGIHEYLQILKQFGLQKSPRLVIMNIYEGNDLRDAINYYDYRWGDDKEGEDLQRPTSPETEPVDLLGRYSYTFNLGLAAWSHWLESGSVPSFVAEDEPAEETEAVPSYQPPNFRYRLVFGDREILFNPENTDTDEVEHARLLANLDPDNPIGQARARAIESSIEEALATFVELARQHRFVPVVSYTPSAYTAYAANVVFEDPSVGEVMPWFSGMQRTFFAQKGERLGYQFIDLTPAIQAAAQAGGPDNLLYYRYDLHLTPAGHTVVAEAMLQGLQTDEILSQVKR